MAVMRATRPRKVLSFMINDGLYFCDRFLDLGFVSSPSSASLELFSRRGRATAPRVTLRSALASETGREGGREEKGRARFHTTQAPTLVTGNGVATLLSLHEP